MFRFVTGSLVLLAAVASEAVPMVRVIDVTGPHTIVVDRNGIAATLVLGGIAVPPGEEQAATAYLRKTLLENWVLVETNAAGEAFLFRSPDALYVNGELARRAYAHPGTEMIYLGQSMPGPSRSRSRAKASAASSDPPAAPTARSKRSSRRRH